MTLFGFRIIITRDRQEQVGDIVANAREVSTEDWLLNNAGALVHYSRPYQQRDEKPNTLIQCRLGCERHGNTIYSESFSGVDAKQALQKAVLGIEASSGSEWRATLPIQMAFVQIEGEADDPDKDRNCN